MGKTKQQWRSTHPTGNWSPAQQMRSEPAIIYSAAVLGKSSKWIVNALIPANYEMRAHPRAIADTILWFA